MARGMAARLATACTPQQRIRWGAALQRARKETFRSREHAKRAPLSRGCLLGARGFGGVEWRVR